MSENVLIKNIPEALVSLQNEFDDFIYLASHDLKEPARKISTFGERLSNSLKGRLSEEEQDFFDRMMNAAHRQQAMIDDLLKLSRIKTIEFKKQKIMLHELLNDLKLGANTELKFNCPKVAYGDMVQLKFVLQELIDNAEKFAKTRPVIRITTKSIFSTVIDSMGLNSSRNYAYLIFTDEGMTIPRDQLVDIFRPFYRVQGRADNQGAGMGLAISKAIMDKMGGAIWAESDNIKTSFHLLLPAA